MATALNRPQREVIDFRPNTPVTVALKYNQGKHVAGQYGDRMLFTTCDNRVFFLDPATAGKIESAGINVRESFTITQKWDGVKGSPRTWEIARVAGEQPNGTFAVPALSRPGASATTAERHATAGELLVLEANALVDAYATVLERALSTYGGRVKRDEVRSILLSAYIQRRQLSSVA
jgi:hypothetical protein